MRTTIFSVVALLALAGGVAVPVETCLACSCAVITPATSFPASMVVFEGRVVDADISGNGPIRHTFDVRHVWSGSPPAQVDIFGSSDRGASSCDVRFDVGRTYLVYARETTGRLRTGACDETAPSPGTAAIIARLGPGTPVTADSAATDAREGDADDRRDENRTRMVIVGMLVVAVVAGGLLGAVRFRRQ